MSDKYIFNKRIPGTDGWEWKFITEDEARGYLHRDNKAVIMNSKGDVLEFGSSPSGMVAKTEATPDIFIDPGNLVDPLHHLAVEYHCKQCNRVVYQLVPGRAWPLPYPCPKCRTKGAEMTMFTEYWPKDRIYQVVARITGGFAAISPRYDSHREACRELENYTYASAAAQLGEKAVFQLQVAEYKRGKDDLVEHVRDFGVRKASAHVDQGS